MDQRSVKKNQWMKCAIERVQSEASCFFS